MVLNYVLRKYKIVNLDMNHDALKLEDYELWIDNFIFMELKGHIKTLKKLAPSLGNCKPYRYFFILVDLCVWQGFFRTIIGKRKYSNMWSKRHTSTMVGFLQIFIVFS